MCMCVCFIFVTHLFNCISLTVSRDEKFVFYEILFVLFRCLLVLLVFAVVCCVVGGLLLYYVMFSGQCFLCDCCIM